MLWNDRASRKVNKSRMPHLVLATCCLLVLCGYVAAAEPDKEHDEAGDLAKTVQNPLANLVTLPLQFNYNRGIGVDDRTFFNMNVQPVIPYPGEKWNIITRTIIPINSVPVGTSGSVFGMGDINLSIFWSPAKPSPLVWGVGPALVLPTASNPELLGSEKWSIGPTGVIFYGIKKWTVGAVASNVWSVAGNSAREDVNFMFV